MTHICVGNLTIIGSDNGLLHGRRQAITWTNVGILLIRPLGTNFSEFLVEILIFSLKKMRLKVLSTKRRPFCLGLNELRVLSSLFADCALKHFQQTCHRKLFNFWTWSDEFHTSGIILCMCPGNRRQRYNVMSFLIGWAHTQNVAVHICLVPWLSVIPQGIHNQHPIPHPWGGGMERLLLWDKVLPILYV